MLRGIHVAIHSWNVLAYFVHLCSALEKSTCSVPESMNAHAHQNGCGSVP